MFVKHSFVEIIGYQHQQKINHLPIQGKGGVEKLFDVTCNTQEDLGGGWHATLMGGLKTY